MTGCGRVRLSLGRYVYLSRRGITIVQRSFAYGKDLALPASASRHGREDGHSVVLMPMIHVAYGSFFANTIRGPTLRHFDLIFHEGHASEHPEHAARQHYRFSAGPLRNATWPTLLLEFSWMLFFAGPIALGNVLRRRGEPLVLQGPMCPGTGPPPALVETDSASLPETCLAMASLGRCDPRAHRLVDEILSTLSAHVAGGSGRLSIVVPWGIAHMRYIERRLLGAGMVEVESASCEHLACGWDAVVVVHLAIWLWWWLLHASVDTWHLWRATGHVAIKMPLYWYWGATLHIGGGEAERSAPGTDAPPPSSSGREK